MLLEVEEKVLNGIKLNEEELHSLLWETNIIHEEYHEKRRWYIEKTIVFKINDKLFALNFSEGNTENQENDYYEQPFEVKEVIEIVEVKKYVEIKENK